TWEELPPHFITSSEKGLGRNELLAYIEEVNVSISESRG
ncbi:MAG: YihA family ribosome biogenesis GTP-binding protein, partial [Bacteroidales bacterium]|nr:YihA family ribosome biogenesis GTP-binding protein [Bacteroidales bacterium]